MSKEPALDIDALNKLLTSGLDDSVNKTKTINHLISKIFCDRILIRL